MFDHFAGCAAVSPKIRNCWLLATNTCPLATTGTRFELPLKFGQLPAGAMNSPWSVLVNATKKIGDPLTFCGRDNAQIIGL